MLFVGIMIVLFGMYVLQRFRLYILSYIGVQFDLTVGNEIVRKILALPTNYLDYSSVSSQIARVKDFDAVRTFFTGESIILIFDVPFVCIFLLAIGFLAGQLVWVPVILVVIFSLIIYLSKIFLQGYAQRAVCAASDYQNLLFDILYHFRVIKGSASEESWLVRFKKLTAKRTEAQYLNEVLENITVVISQVMMSVAALSIITWGAVLALHQDLTFGALIALMILVWRVLMPIKSLFIASSTFSQMAKSCQQIDSLMVLAEESQESTDISQLPLSGNIFFNHVSLRYPQQSRFALSNITFTVKENQALGIMGRSGSGKSSILKCIRNYPAG